MPTVMILANALCVAVNLDIMTDHQTADLNVSFLKIVLWMRLALKTDVKILVSTFVVRNR